MDELVNYGALGIMVLGFVLGFVVAKPTHDKALSDLERVEKQRDDVINDVFTKVAPAIERATQAIKAREEHDSEVYDVLVDIRRMLEQGHQ